MISSEGATPGAILSATPGATPRQPPVNGGATYTPNTPCVAPAHRGGVRATLQNWSRQEDQTRQFHSPVPHRNWFEIAPRMPVATATSVVSLLTIAGLGTAAATMVGSIVASIASTKRTHHEQPQVFGVGRSSQAGPPSAASLAVEPCIRVHLNQASPGSALALSRAANSAAKRNLRAVASGIPAGLEVPAIAAGACRDGTINNGDLRVRSRATSRDHRRRWRPGPVLGGAASTVGLREGAAVFPARVFEDSQAEVNFHAHNSNLSCAIGKPEGVGRALGRPNRGLRGGGKQPIPVTIEA